MMDGAAALSIIVPTTGLEPATFSLGERRAFQLRHMGIKTSLRIALCKVSVCTQRMLVMIWSIAPPHEAFRLSHTYICC